MKNNFTLCTSYCKQICLLLLTAAFCITANHSHAQAAFTTAWPLTLDQSYSTSGAGAATVTAVNQAISSTLYIPVSNSYVGVSSGTAGDGQRCSPRLNDLTDGGWIIDGGAVEGRYEQFEVNPNTGYNMNVTNISFTVGNRSRSELKGTAYYFVGASSAGFTIGTGTLLGSGVGSSNSSTWNSYSYTTNINVASGSKIFVRIYPYNNGSNTTGKYYCTRNVSISGTTTTPNITNLTFTTPVTCDSTRLTISWSGPSGFNPGTQTILAFLKAGGAVTAGTPTNTLATYTPSPVFGSGTNYQNDALGKCIYKGTGTDISGNHSGLTISNLVGGSTTTYHLLIFIVTGTNTYSGPVTGSGNTLTNKPGTVTAWGAYPFSRTLQTTSSIPLNWLAISSTINDGYLLQVSNSATPASPSNTIDLVNQTNVSSGTGNVKIPLTTSTGYNGFTGFQPGTMYYFRINPYVNSGTCIRYSLANRLIQVATLPNAVSAQSFSIDGITGTGTVNWSTPVGYNTNNTTLVFIKNGSAVNTNTASSNPRKDPNSYVANTFFGSGSPYYFDPAAYCIHNGDGNSATVTNLIPGNTYHILIITAVKNTSNTGVAASSGIETGGVTWSYSSYATTSTVYGGTYTWNAGNTAGNFAAAASWTPLRSTPTVADQLIFNTGENITPTGFTSQTIGTLTVTGNTTLNMNQVSTTLTINSNNGAASDVIVNSGSSLNLSGGHTLLLNAGATADVSGNLNVNAFGTYTMSATGSISTVSGTLKNAGTLNTIANNIVVNNNGTFDHALDGATIPTCVWNTGSTCKVSGITSASGISGHSQIFSRFVYDCPLQGTQNFVFGVGTSAMEAVESFTVNRTGAGSLQLTSTSGQKDYTFGNYYQFGGTVSITQSTGGPGQRSVTVNNNFYASDSLGNTRFYLMNNPSNDGAFGRLFVAGNLVMRRISINNVSIDNSAGTNFAEIWFNGSSNQYAQFSTITGNIDFNTAQTVPGFGVTLGSNATAYKFYLSQGTFNIASNTLTINNTVTYPSPATGTLGGSSTSNLTLGFAGTTGTLNFASTKRILKDYTQLASNVTALGTELAITAGLTPGSVSLGANAIFTTNDNLILRSDADGTARISTLPSTATIPGRVTVERHLPMNPAYDSRRWRLLTAPFKATNSPTISAAWQQSASNTNRLAPVNPKPGYGTQITKSTVWAADGYDQGSTNNASIFYYNGGPWAVPANTNAVKITDNSGVYMIFARGDRSTVITNQFVAASSTTLEPKGELYVGNVTIPMVASGFQTVGNPYASAIRLDNVQFNDTLGNNKTVYLWDPKALGSYNVGKFIACSGDGVAPFYTYVGNSSNYNAAPGVIESSGAFLVKANGGNIVFHESDKITTSTTIGIASRPNRNPAAFGTISKLYVDMMAFKNAVPSLADGVAITFNKNYTNAIDGMDADKLSTFFTREELSINRAGKLLAIERRKEVDEQDTVFLNISKLNATAYQFGLRPVGFDENHSAFFEDAYKGTSTPIDLINDGAIDFNITTDSASYAKDRFYIIFKKKKTLVPVVEKAAFTVFPNPVQNGIVNLQMSGLPAGEYNLKLLNNVGQTIQVARLLHQNENAVEQFEISKTIAKGMYKLQIISPDKSITVTSVIVQ